MSTVKEDYTRPLEDIYESFPESTRNALAKDIRAIWTYFSAWVFFVAAWSVIITILVACVIEGSPLGSRLQRVGSIIPFLAVLGETLFIVRLNKLVSVIHPAQLTYEIYKQRRFKPLVYVSLIVTFLIVGSGAVLSGYGDLIF